MSHDGSQQNPWGDEPSPGSSPSGPSSSPQQGAPHHQQASGPQGAHHQQASAGAQGAHNQAPPHNYPPPESNSASGMAIASLITGILSILSASLLLCCGALGTLVSGPLAIAAVVLAYSDWSKIQVGQSSSSGKVMVIIGGGLGALAGLANAGMCGLTALMML